MNKVVSYAQEDNGFYPTPPELAQKMISGIDFNFVQTILEPSAGNGRKKYKDMDTEEKAVVDSFQGEAAYNEVLAKSDYYLAPPTGNTVLMLGA